MHYRHPQIFHCTWRKQHKSHSHCTKAAKKKSHSHCTICRLTILLNSLISHLLCHPAEGMLPDCLAPQSPCSGHCLIRSLPLNAQLGLMKKKRRSIQHSRAAAVTFMSNQVSTDFPAKSATICPCKEASVYRSRWLDLLQRECYSWHQANGTS